MPTINYRLKGKTAEKPTYNSMKSRLNPILFIENQQAFLQEVIPHEVAHLFVGYMAE